MFVFLEVCSCCFRNRWDDMTDWLTNRSVRSGMEASEMFKEEKVFKNVIWLLFIYLIQKFEIWRQLAVQTEPTHLRLSACRPDKTTEPLIKWNQRIEWWEWWLNKFNGLSVSLAVYTSPIFWVHSYQYVRFQSMKFYCFYIEPQWVNVYPQSLPHS